jgi:hypothetical protein
MAYEDSAGLNVHNQYGPRKSGGEQGVFRKEGFDNEFVVSLPLLQLDAYKLPVRNNIKVYKVDTTFATGTVSAVTVGGVDVLPATEDAPVQIPQGNTGVVAQTGGTGGYIIIKFHNVPGDDFPLS